MGIPARLKAVSPILLDKTSSSLPSPLHLFSRGFANCQEHFFFNRSKNHSRKSENTFPLALPLLLLDKRKDKKKSDDDVAAGEF